MSKYFSRETEGLSIAKPPAAQLTGLTPMKRTRAVAVMHAQDTVHPQARRVLFRGGLRGEDQFASSAASLIENTDRLIGWARTTMTPGSDIIVRAIYAPTGQPVDGGGTDTDPRGSIRVAVSWTASDGATTTSDGTTFQMAASQEASAAEPTGAAEMWDVLRDEAVRIAGPHHGAPSTAWAWSSSPLTATIIVYMRDAPRLVDLVIYEVPTAIAYEADDTHADTTLVHALGPTLPPAPVRRMTDVAPDGDPRAGGYHVTDVYQAQVAGMGPAILHWSSWTDATQIASPTQTDDGGVAVSSTSWTELLGGGDGDGWVMAGDGQPHAWADRRSILRGRLGAQPCRLWVRGYVTAAGATGTVRLVAGDAAVAQVEITATSTTPVMSRRIVLPVGLTAEQMRNARMEVKHSGSGETRVQDVVLAADVT